MVRKKRPLAIRDLVLMGLFSAILFGVQLAFAFLPNVELVSLLIILYTRHLKYRALPVIYVFVVLEGLVFGFGIWWFIYLYIWAVLFAMTMMMQKSSVSARMGDTFRRVRALLRCAGCGFLYLFERAASSVCLVCGWNSICILLMVLEIF